MRLALLSNGSERNLEIPPGWGKSTKNPLRRCTLAAEHYVTAAEE
jgi:hypothetical protein